MTARTLHVQASEAVLAGRSELATALVEREFVRHPELEQRYGTAGRAKSRQDAEYHLSFLAQALALESPMVFTEYVAWAKVVLGRRKGLASDLAFHLECLAEVVREGLAGEPGAVAAGFIAAAIQAMPEMPEDLPTFLRDGAPLSPLAHQYFEALRRGDRRVASELVLDAVAGGTSVKQIYLEVFQPAQYEIGRLWQTNRITVAQEHYCTAATQLIMSQLYPHVFATPKHGYRLVATCVAGDLHEIGVRMVADFFEMAGWDTYYLGANTPHESVAAEVHERRAHVLCVSVTMPYHVELVRTLIDVVRRDPVAGQVKILVGGYPFNRDPDLWRSVGADGSARDADEAIALADRLVARPGA